MTFDELVLLTAIRRAGGNWGDLLLDAERVAFARKVADSYTLITQDVRFPFSVDDVIRLKTLLRKGKNNRVKADIALAHGYRCFWHGRGKGPCTNEAEAGHLVPRCQGGELTVENAMIECRGHNNQRRDMTIEEYLQSGMTL
jgi:hypothetical protein